MLFLTLSASTGYFSSAGQVEAYFGKQAVILILATISILMID